MTWIYRELRSIAARRYRVHMFTESFDDMSGWSGWKWGQRQKEEACWDGRQRSALLSVHKSELLRQSSFCLK